MIIICKGIKKNGKLEKCNFVYDGKWGDSDLVDHQKFHEHMLDSSIIWLGFDSPQLFGKYSNRDGKRY